MSERPTPRTDAKANLIMDGVGPANNQRFTAMADFARSLERQLAEAKEKEAAMSQIAVSCQCPSKDAELAILRGQLAERDAQQARVLTLLKEAREYLPMNMAAYERIQNAINELQQ